MSAAPDADRAALVALASLPGVGPATLEACRRDPGATEAWELILQGRHDAHPALARAAQRLDGRQGRGLIRRAAQAIDPGELLARHRRDGQTVVVPGDDGYPRRLVDDPAPPVVLFLRGDGTVLEGPAVAIVGTRNATRLGCEMAVHLALELAQRGVAVVSGLAFGIDAASHRPLVATGEREARCPGAGRPVAVVGSGLDQPYPARHGQLQARVAQSGVVLGETPMGQPALPWRFPARNRIIAALADAVVVVESRSAGGSMLTAAEALRRDVPVLAVPGHPRSPAAAGPLDLIADGAMPVRDVEDVLVAMGLGGRRKLALTDAGETSDGGPGGAGPEAGPALGSGEREVIAALGAAAQTLGLLVEETGLPLAEVASACSRLEQRELVARQGSWFELTTAGARLDTDRERP